MQISTKTILNLLNKDLKKSESKASGVSLDQNAPKTFSNTTIELNKKISNLLKDLLLKSSHNQNISLKIEQLNVDDIVKNTKNQLKQLIDLLAKSKEFKEFIPKLEKALLDIKQVSHSSLKKSLSNSGINFESKLSSNIKSLIPVDLKEILNNIKLNTNEIYEKNSRNLKNIDLLINSGKLDKNRITNILKELKPFLSKKEFSTLNSAISKEYNLEKVPTIIKQKLQSFQQIQRDISQSLENLQNHKVANKEFLKDIKNLIVNLKKNISPDHRAQLELISELENRLKDTLLLQNSSQKQSKNIEKIDTLLKTLKSDLLKDTTLFHKDKEIFALVKNIVNIQQNSKLGDIQTASLSLKIQRVINFLKSELNIDFRSSFNEVESMKLANRLENSIKKHISTKKLTPNQILLTQKNFHNEISNDLKANLLNLQHKVSKTATSSKEIAPLVDKIVNHIEYFQLLSLNGNSFNSFLPIDWDELLDGKVEFKRIKQKSFFCEINLTLKKYKEVDIILMLFDDIHINISVYTESKEFISLFRGDQTELKAKLNNTGLILENINFFNEKRRKGSFTFDQNSNNRELDLQV